ncbi:BrnT family toxin [Rhodopseudomonas palustris]|uniref:BrnT family toxin n=1 Tax=Rhodopseudomonas palustris TaxID=1076 RepID=A0A323UD72_RHOPL|nr:BrnT family toxin [Rhodopseudomonas palustris]PZA10239.1 BrnT family toxin [Rhodopseudomonas palustris]
MRITFDPAKREATLLERKLDFNDAVEVFAGQCIHIPDKRRDYGEERIITVGKLLGRMVIVVWTPRGEARHVISMRKANDREKARFGQRLEEG